MINFLKKIRDLYLIKIKYRRFNIGKNFHAGRNITIWAKENVQIGENCYMGAYSHIGCNVVIGNDVLMAKNVSFVGRYDHNYQQIGIQIRNASQVRDIDYSWKELNRITVVEDGVWIGHGVIIMSGVKIKKGAIVAAGSVVTKDLNAYSIYGGNPARKISERFDSKKDIIDHEKKISRLNK
jgi:chloramphenicol O-acetyltransferase type B